MKHLELNRIAIWSPKALDEFSVRKSPAGRTALKNGVFTKTDKETYRFAKNYSTGKGKTAQKFCLFFVSYDDDQKNAEAFLDSVAKNQIDIATVQRALMTASVSDFEYLDTYYGKETK